MYFLIFLHEGVNSINRVFIMSIQQYIRNPKIPTVKNLTDEDRQ